VTLEFSEVRKYAEPSVQSRPSLQNGVQASDAANIHLQQDSSQKFPNEEEEILLITHHLIIAC